MKKYALGAAVVALGIVHQAQPASADKLDDLIKRMDAIEQNNKQLAKENAALRSQLRTKPAPATTTIMAAPAGKPGATVTGVATPPHALDAPEIDAQGHGFLEHKKGNPLTFYTPGGEITAYGNFDISIDNTTKNLNNFDTSFAPPSTPFPVGNFGWMPAISTNSSYLGVRGFQRLPNFPFNFVYQLEVGYDISTTPSLRQSNSQISDTVNGSLFNRNTWVGFANPEFGAIKIGKTYAPYETSTGGFNPFASQIGDMRVVMGKRAATTGSNSARGSITRSGTNRRPFTASSGTSWWRPVRTAATSATIFLRAEVIVRAATIRPAADFSRMAVTTARSAAPSVPI